MGYPKLIPEETKIEPLELVGRFVVRLADVPNEQEDLLDHISLKVSRPLHLMDLVIDVVDLLADLALDPREVFVRQYAAEKLLLRDRKLLLKVQLPGHEPFLFRRDARLLFFVEGFHLSHNLLDEFGRELEPIESLLHLPFKIPGLHIIFDAFNPAADTVTVIIRLPFLEIVLGDIPTAVQGAKDKTVQEERVPALAARIPIVFREDSLAAIKNIFRDDSFVVPLLDLPHPVHISVVEGAAYEFEHLTPREHLPGQSDKPFLVHHIPHVDYRIIAGAVQLEHFCDKRCPQRIGDDDPLLRIVGIARVQIPDRGLRRPPSFVEFLLHAFERLTGCDLRLQLVHARDDEIHKIAFRRILHARLGH
ncbi:MAG TPA: hypothetical protein VMA75_04965 [Candidatus Paceibacterota bacterium]|nr:hypothetical protein [Candidatus Paceibacterota bacterium]